MKRLLKLIPLMRSLNALVKDCALSAETAWWERVYRPRVAGLPPEADEAALRARVRRRMLDGGVRPVGGRKGDLHVFFVGTYYDHEAFGFLQALERLGRVTVYADAEGRYGINSSARADGSPARQSDNLHLVEAVRAAHERRLIDIVIGTFVATTVSVRTLCAIRAMGIPVVNFAMDDRLPLHWRRRDGVRMGAVGLIEGVDLTLQTTKAFVPRYLAEGGPCLYFPFASDPELFRPSQEKSSDVVFVGNNYGRRAALIEALTRAGIRVDCYGNGFPRGHLPGRLVPETFARARVVLGSGLVGHSSSIVTLKVRDFDAPMSGTFYITTRNPELAEHFAEGKEIETYSTPRECAEKIRYYLEHEEEREAVAAAGRRRAARDHTWDRRFEGLLGVICGPGREL